ncbi:hypothetical protein KY290_027468 [Solanum tuberosum]|uniref:Uncharacterized protein n=1 Tax=Solanum tuberosum TaxID=4113 RepID=A0ABQ7UGX7_SOLTU|nr:hypothetical protein KY285_026397 [Solanum tuberosum]KAH0748236.1 hypothetical protein KY290_027468 [Solanum tuberosum]
MAREPPVGTFRPPDQSQQGRLGQTNKTHRESPSNSSHNSMNSRINEAMNCANPVRELAGIQKIISPDRDRLIRGKLLSENDSTQGLQHTTESEDSTLPIARSGEVIYGKITTVSPGLSPQIRAISQQFHGDLNTGDYSPDEEVHLTGISSEMDGPIAGDINSGDRAIENWKIVSGVSKET